MHESYQAWVADYRQAGEQGRDRQGRDIFDLLVEKMHGAEIGLWFNGTFHSGDLANGALRSFEAMGYDYNWMFEPGPQKQRKDWLLHVSRTFPVTTADAFRDEISAGEALLEGFEAADIEWEFEPLGGHPGTGPPL